MQRKREYVKDAGGEEKRKGKDRKGNATRKGRRK